MKCSKENEKSPEGKHEDTKLWEVIKIGKSKSKQAKRIPYTKEQIQDMKNKELLERNKCFTKEIKSIKKFQTEMMQINGTLNET